MTRSNSSSDRAPLNSGAGEVDPQRTERSAWRALDAAEFELVLARAEELEACGRTQQALALRREVREGLIGQMLADPTRSVAARWLGLLVRVDPDAAETFERRARQGGGAPQEPSAAIAKETEMPAAASAAASAAADLRELDRAASESTPSGTLALGTGLDACGLRLRLDGLGELVMACARGVNWAAPADRSAPAGSRFEPGLWLSVATGGTALCLPLGPGHLCVLDDRGGRSGPLEQLELADGRRFEWAAPSSGGPRQLQIQRLDGVWLLAIQRGPDLAGQRRLAWWPGPGRLQLDPASKRLPLGSLPAPLDLEFEAGALQLGCTAGLAAADGREVSAETVRRDLPLSEPEAFTVGGRAWLRIEPWGQPE